MHMQNANLTAAHIWKINRRKIHTGRGAALRPEARKFFSHINRNGLLRFLGAAANVWRKNDIGQSRQRRGKPIAIFCGFLWKNINCGAANMATFQGCRQRHKVNHFAAAVVHQHGAGFHVLQLRRAN